MKKIITSGFVLASLIAQAQEGKVGVNTNVPKATLDVQMKSTSQNGTTNEGIIAPKLTKDRVAKIAASELTEGTLVYVEDVTYTPGADTAVEARVAKITEKGYYFYNGTEWVKSGNDASSGEWVYDASTNRIDLKRSGQASGFVNKVFYDAETGKRVVASHENFVNEFHNTDGTSSLSSSVSDLSTMTKGLDNRISLTSSIPTYTDGNGNVFKTLKYDKMMVDATTTNVSHHRLSETVLNVNSDNTNNYSSVYNATNITNLYGTGTISNALGQWGQVSISNSQKISSYTSGVLGVMGVYTSGEVSNAYSMFGRTYFGSSGAVVGQAANLMLSTSHMNGDNTLIKAYTGIRNSIESNSQNTGTGNTLMGMYNTIQHNGKTKYLKMYGIYIQNTIGQGAADPDDNYGLYVNSVTGGLNSNYSIYTNVGAVRFGDLAGAGNRPVFADANGKLIIGDATNAATSFKWVEDAANTSVKLAVTSAGVERTTAPVSITDTGMVKATSFQGTNGATIFPDYVFQTYYDGVSDIKADYTFKSLDQVEDFVKVNGHLPGYKSASEIKKQGYIDIMETQLTNVEKIEELYLHSIEQDKVNKAQAEELKAKDAKIEKLEAKNQELEARLSKLEQLWK